MRAPLLSSLLSILIFALLACAIVALQTGHFQGRPFRQDEAWIVHGAIARGGVDAMVQWVSVNIHPPLWVIVANSWVDVFGEAESVVRFLSVLITLFTLALTYRLAADLGGKQRRRWVGLLAVFLLGTSQFFNFYTQEFRPYPALIACSLGAVWAYLRWLRLPNGRYAAIFVAFGIAALYIHFFAAYVLLALVLLTPVLILMTAGTRAQRLTKGLKAFGLFFAIGLSYLGWILPFLHAVLVVNPGGVDYAIEPTRDPAQIASLLLTITRNMSFKPLEIALFLFITATLTAVFTALFSAFRRSVGEQGRGTRNLYALFVLLIGLVVLAIAFGVNALIANLTQRSLALVLPLAACFLAYGLATLPRAGQIAATALLLPAAFTFVDYVYPGPQREVAAAIAPYYQPGDLAILNVTYVPNHIAVLYYLQNRMGMNGDERIPADHLWQVLDVDAPSNRTHIEFMPYEPVHVMAEPDAESLAALRAFVEAGETVWYIERDGGNSYAAPIQRVLADAGYTPVNRQTWPREYTLVEYRWGDEPPPDPNQPPE